MGDDARGAGSWLVLLLPLVCCGGPLLVLLGAAALPALWAWVTAETSWLAPAAGLLAAAAGYLAWRRRRPPGCEVRPSEPSADRSAGVARGRSSTGSPAASGSAVERPQW